MWLHGMFYRLLVDGLFKVGDAFWLEAVGECHMSSCDPIRREMFS